jgi:hypothetical protein
MASRVVVAPGRVWDWPSPPQLTGPVEDLGADGEVGQADAHGLEDGDIPIAGSDLFGGDDV